ncbi:MAG: response regulator [Beijerinckiaceae bacterium]
MPKNLHGRRILVVEDDALLALGYDEVLKDAGAEVVGPVATVDEAGKLVVANGIAVALLDIRLGDEEVWPVAHLLAGRGVPFVFCTGHFDSSTLPAEWSERPVLTKPARPKQIIAALAKVLAVARGDRGT